MLVIFVWMYNFYFKLLPIGAKGGRTLELAEAEAVLEVCRWRKRTLINEKKGLLKPPKPVRDVLFVLNLR